jgi:hypothetical protein
MIQTAHIDIKAVIDQLSCIAWLKPVKARGEIVYKGGPCPFCHVGQDRFAVFPEGDKPHFYCGIHGNGCGAHGDVIAFIQQLKGYASAYQAIQDLQEMGYPIGDPSVASGVRYSTWHPEAGAPSKKWQEQGNVVVHEAIKCLWSPTGQKQLDYLRGRGLKDETIRHFRLGYWPEWYKTVREAWGIETADETTTLYLRPAILIPCYEGSTLWGINQRLTEYTTSESARIAQGKRLPRYRKREGSGNGLFNVDAIRPGEPCFMAEGEIDAMTFQQETGLPVVATGSTKGAQLSRWVAALSLPSHLVIAFDDDGKGEQAAEYWTDLFEDNALFYPPWAKDINDMLREGQDIAMWANMGREIASCPPIVEPIQPVSSVPIVCQEQDADLPADCAEMGKVLAEDVCAVCGAEVEHYGENGEPYCVSHWALHQRSTPVFPPYCPVCLPTLPRATCPHRVIYEDNRRYVKSRICNAPTLEHGWCTDHTLSHEILVSGAKIGYPAFTFNPYRDVSAGVIQWEEYAQIISQEHLSRDLAVLNQWIARKAS